MKEEFQLLVKSLLDHFAFPAIFFNEKGILLSGNKDADKLVSKLKSRNLCGILFDNDGNITNIDSLEELRNGITTDKIYDREYMLFTESYTLNNKVYAFLLFKENTSEVKSKFDNTTNTFLANVSHEIRTPLNGIIGFAELIMKKTLSPEKVKDYSKIIYTNGSYLLKLITDMLDLSRIEAGKLTLYKTQFSINRLIYDIQLFFLLDMKNRNKQHIMFKSSIGLPDGSDHIFADELRIKQVIINLIGNSIKFTEKGSITIGYKIVTESTLEFFVKDTGIGMSQEAANNIFKRFVQANDAIASEYGGTGLGLSISKEFVEMHGGKIWVESEVNQGTTFLFTLPLKQ